MIGLVWQRRVRIAAMRGPSHKFTPNRRGTRRANQVAECSGRKRRSVEKTIFFAILWRKGEPSNPLQQFKRGEAYQLNRNRTPFHSR